MTHNLRLPTKREYRQLLRYVMKARKWPFEFADYDVTLWFVAVYKAYAMCNHKGKTMVAIDTDGSTYLFAWDRAGGLYRIWPSVDEYKASQDRERSFYE